MHLRTSSLSTLLLIATAHVCSAQTVRGHLEDKSSAARNTQLLITDGRNKQIRVKVDSAGNFDSGRINTGDFIVAYEVGGRLLGGGPFPLGVKEVLNLDILVAADSPHLAITAKSNRLPSLARTGFYERMATYHGEFLTREDIDGKGPSLSRVLTRVRSVRVVSNSGGFDATLKAVNGSIYAGEQAAVACYPAIYLNGSLVRQQSMGAQSTTIDDIESPNNIEAIEIYTGIDAPPMFKPTVETCGAIALWSRTNF